MDLLIWILGSLLGATWRITINDPHGLNLFNDCSAKRIYCLWHSNLLALAYIFRNTGKTVIVSESNDGRIAAAVARRWKYAIIAGSSSRNGSAAARESLRLLAAGRCLVITADGPRGPRHEVKPGAAFIAAGARAPVVTLDLKVDRAWRLNTWDTFMIPKPFARLRVTIAEPLIPPAQKPDQDSIEQFRQSIEKRMCTS
jgi:lysophospholipid acyltransferase (LPLAT)-like uncharacterized protein